MRKLTVLTIVSLLFAMIGCSTEHGNPVSNGGNDSYKPGSFAVSAVKGLGKNAADNITDEPTNYEITYDLGDIKGSSSFYFILSNSGNTPITDINIQFSTNSLFNTSFIDTNGFVSIDSLSNSNLNVSPRTINILDPKLITSVLRVNIIHGTSISGYGFTPVLPQGTYKFKMIITGKTKTYMGNDTTVGVACNLIVRIKSMNIDISSSNGNINFGDITYVTSESWFIEGMDLINIRNYQIKDTSFIIRNTGSVPIKLRGYTNTIMSLSDTIIATIGVTDSLRINFGSTKLSVLSLDGGNATTDQTKLPLQLNGRCYLFINKI